MRLRDEIAIVTGGASGIGLATVRLFLTEGASEIDNDLDSDALGYAMRDLPGERVLAWQEDASDPALGPLLVAAAVDRFGGLDVVVANAGMASFGDVESTSHDTFRRMLDVNVGGPFLLSKAAMPELRKTSGAIVMTASVAGLGGDWGLLACNTSKGAVANMVRAMAMDAGAHGVRVNVVAPSLTDTGLTKGLQSDPDFMALFLDRIPLGRMAKPEDIASAILFLASDDARFVTGVVLPVGGGVSASSGQPRMTGED